MVVNQILMLDDDELYNILITEIFHSVSVIKNFKIENSGWKALDFLRDAEKKGSFPEIIFVDLKMPEMDGFEFIERYEANFFSRHSETQINVLTSSVRELDKQKATAFKSVKNFLVKPLNEEKLLKMIEAYVKENNK